MITQKKGAVPESQGEGLITKGRRLDFGFHRTREPVILALLSTVAVVFFSAVSGLSGIYHAQQKSLGIQWFARGTKDLGAQRFAPAVAEFRSALLYSRDNYSYQLSLAQALLGQNRTDEASAYLSNLWDREPENGFVNLYLARIAVQKEESDQALRYYHNAIYATWPDDQRTARRDARLELIDYLLKINDKPQAQSELIALAANWEGDTALQARIGGLFLKAQDYRDALKAYRVSFEGSRKDPGILAGAGRAAFELRQYRDAHQYLQAAVEAGSREPDVPAKLKTAELVLQMDPFRRQISIAERGRLVIEAYTVAGQHLDSCIAATGSGPAGEALQNLSETWTTMKPQMTERGLRRNPDLTESAMELVFNIERQSASGCSATPADQALLLIGKLHEGN